MLAKAFALSSALFVASLLARGAHAQVVADSAAIVPLRQTLDLVVDPAKSEWSGSLRAWLDVRGATRHVVLRLRDVSVSRVEMNQHSGVVGLVFGSPRGDSLLVETDRELAPGAAGLNVGFVAPFADSGDGFVRTGRRSVALARGAAVAIPAWPAGTRGTPWTIDVHVPAGYTVRANLPRTEITRQDRWRTWSFATRRAWTADSLRITVARTAPKR